MLHHLILLFIFESPTLMPPSAPNTSTAPPEEVPSLGDNVDGQGKERDPEFIAVVLAATSGTRLFPLTSDGDDDDLDDEFGALTQMEDGKVGGEDGLGRANVVDGPAKEGLIDLVEGSEAEMSVVPKHLLPIAGTTILRRLLDAISSAGLTRCVVAVSSTDGGTTATSLLSESGVSSITVTEGTMQRLRLDGSMAGIAKSSKGKKDAHPGASRAMDITVASLGASCGGSADAIRHLSSMDLLPERSHVVVMPGDLVLGSAEGDGSVLRLLADAHRRGQAMPLEQQRRVPSSRLPPAWTALLSDVGDEDENGVPLKESAKAKKGALARDEEEIEFIGLSSPASPPSPHQPSFPQRLLIKQSKVVVEEDEGTGSTPKLILPKGIFHHAGGPASTMIRTDVHDLHVYALSPWVVRLLSVRTGLSSLQKEVLPLLISRQFRGVAAAFGSTALEGSSDGRETLESVLAASPFAIDAAADGTVSITASNGEDGDQNGGLSAEGRSSPPSPPFSVSAQVLDRRTSRLTLRCATIPSYIYGCREIVAAAVNDGNRAFPEGSKVNAKFQSLLLPGATVGEKVTLKSSTIGQGAKVGSRCRLNNVIIMDGVSVGDNCILQNSVLGARSVVLENCNLNDCQVAPGAEVPSLTKEKGESFTRE